MGHGHHSKEISWEGSVGRDAAHYIHNYRKLTQQRAVKVTPCQDNGYEVLPGYAMVVWISGSELSSITHVKEKIITHAPSFGLLPHVNLQVT